MKGGHRRGLSGGGDCGAGRSEEKHTRLQLQRSSHTYSATTI